MRKGSLSLTFDNFVGWLKWYDEFLEKVYHSQRVVKTSHEKIEIFEAFVPRIDAIWHLFVEDLLIDCLNRNTSQYAKHTGTTLPKHLPRQQCKVMVTGLGYFDFKSVGDIKKTARSILTTGYNPFKKIPKDAAKMIDQFFKIRNYVVHYSYASRRALLNMYKKEYGMKCFREPGRFLMAIDPQVGQIRFSTYIRAFIDATYEMGLFLQVY